MATRLFNKIRSVFASEVGATRTNRPTASEYIEWLPRYMLQTSQTEIRIDSNLPLPGANETDPDRIPPCIPDTEAVVNRIKVLCGLNPFRFSEPMEGEFEETLMNHRLKFSVHFSDSENRSTCTLYLSVSNT